MSRATSASIATGTSCSRSCACSQTGIQLLSGSCSPCRSPRSSPDLDEAQKSLYLALVVLAGVCVGVNLTPIMLHRRVFGDHVKERVVKVGHLLSQVVIVGIALLIVGTVILIFSVVVELDGRSGRRCRAGGRPRDPVGRDPPPSRTPLSRFNPGAVGRARRDPAGHRTGLGTDHGSAVRECCPG